MFSIKNYIILFIILIILGFFYRRFEDKRLQQEEYEDYESIRKYLLNDVNSLDNSKKPILWIHIPYEYNSRNWLNFGSRSSFELNQPYLYLTVKSIIQKCDKSFNICLIDDSSFKKLIPNWDIEMKLLGEPIINKIRYLGCMKLINNYGGMFVPISFVCFKNLIDLYEKSVAHDKMFVSEVVNKNITSTEYIFYPSMCFMGAKKENQTMNDFIKYMEREISRDFTADSIFTGKFETWIEEKVRQNKINMIDGMQIGTKTIDDEPIILDDLLSDNYLNLYPNAYGILIPYKEIINRTHYAWFARLSAKQVLESNIIISKYLLLAIVDENNTEGMGVIKKLKPSPNWVGFWDTPNYPGLYGLKPNFLGDNLQQVPYTGR